MRIRKGTTGRILQSNEIKLVGVASYQTFSEACQKEIPQMYDPNSPSYLYDRALNIFYLSWGITGKALAEACKPFISDQLYQSALSDTKMWFSPECDNISNFIKKVQCRYTAKTGV